MQNFTVADLLQTTLATLAFALFLLPTGYLLCIAGNLFGVRRSSVSEQVLFSTAFSVATTPIVAVLFTRMFSYQFTLAVFLLLAVISVLLFLRRWPSRTGSSGIQRSTLCLLAVLLLWFLVVLFSLTDIQVGQRLYLNFVAYDHSLRVPLVEAASRNGVPPLNPFYGLGGAPVLRYYYYWYVVCALPMQLFGLGARACLNASIFWSGVGIASLVPLFLKHFLAETANLRRKSVIGVALLAVTGLDLMPYTVVVIKFHLFLGDMEWWDVNQVTSWIGSLLWVPHHVAALTACMAGLLVLSATAETSSAGERARAAAVAGIAFASAAGLSIYVTFTFALFAVMWSLLLLVQGKTKSLLTYVSAGALSLVLSWPFLGDLLSKSAGSSAVAGPGERFAMFAIRDLPLVVGLFRKLGFHSHLLLEVLKVPTLLVVYLLEFGVFLLVAVLCFRRDVRVWASLSAQRRMAWVMFATCLLAMSILRSDATLANDLGLRGMLVVQFILLIWSAPVVDEIFFTNGSTSIIKVLAIIMLVLGAAGTLYQVAALRCYAPIIDHGKLERCEDFLGAPGFAERTFYLRDGLSRLRASTSSSTVVQYNPIGQEVLMVHLYSARQAVMGNEECGNAFGGDALKCSKVFPYVASIFNAPAVVRNWNLNAICDRLHINILVATDMDPAWQDRDGWVWSRPSLLANPAMRAIPCGTPQ